MRSAPDPRHIGVGKFLQPLRAEPVGQGALVRRVRLRRLPTVTDPINQGSAMRNPNTSSFSIRCLAGAVLALTGVGAIAATPASDVQARYEQERARCMAGQSGQAQDTCMKEAVNARDAAKKGQLSDGDGKLHKNARERCDALTGDEQRDCLARTRANGNSVSGASVTSSEGSASIVKSSSTSGSVKGGGVLRETVTTETVVGAPVVVPTPASAASR